MSFYSHFDLIESSDADCAACNLVLTDHPQVAIHLNLMAFGANASRKIVGYLSSSEDSSDFTVEVSFTKPRWAGPEVNCDLELHQLLSSPEFGDCFLLRVAQAAQTQSRVKLQTRWTAASPWNTPGI